MKHNRKRLQNAFWTCVCILVGNAMLALAVAAFILSMASSPAASPASVFC